MREIDWLALDAALTDSSFGPQTCLTFYLCGPAENHRKMFPDLRALNATNLHDEEGGFVYAKVPVALTREDIASKISSVRKFAEKANIEVDIIDLDSSPDIARTKFHTLWTPDAQTH